MYLQCRAVWTATDGSDLITVWVDAAETVCSMSAVVIVAKSMMNDGFLWTNTPTRLTPVRVDITREGQVTIPVVEPPSVELPEIRLWVEYFYALRVPLRGALYDLSAASRGNTCGVVIVDDDWPVNYHPMDIRPDAMPRRLCFLRLDLS